MPSNGRTPEDARMSPGFFRAASGRPKSIYFFRPDVCPGDVRAAFFIEAIFAISILQFK